MKSQIAYLLKSLALLAVAWTGAAFAQEPAASPDEAAAIETAAPSEAIPPLIPTEKFAGRIGFWGAKLSPDASVMTIFQKAGKNLQMTVIDPRTREPINAINFAPGTYVDWVEWIDNDRMLINAESYLGIFGVSLRSSRMYIAFPKEGKAEPLITDPRGFDDGQLVHIEEGGQTALIAHRGKGRRWEPGVYRYELKPGGAVSRILEPKRGVDVWVADDKGVVRLGLGWRRKKLSIFYRESEGGEFRRIAKIKDGDEEGYFDAIQILSGSSQGYVLDEDEEGRVGLRVFDYAKREVIDTFYEHPEWDVEDVWLEEGRPIAAFYTDDRSQVVWFDEGRKASHEKLQGALEGFEIWVVSSSDDGKQMLVNALHEGDPGVLYFYDAQAGTLNEFAQYRPGLDFRMLVRPKPFTYTARDGTEIRAYLTLPKGRDPKNLPLIIHPHGGPFGIRDQLRYDDQVQFLANRGYAVLQPNFRGSGGYGTEFYDLGIGEVGRGMQDDLDDAMDWAVAEGIADPARVCIVGGSYGGYAALWGALRNPERYRCAASWAGVTDWTKMLKYDRRVLTRKAGKRWSAKIEGDDEELDLKDVSPYRLAEGLNRPVLLAHGTADSNVPIKQFEQMVKAARKAPVKLTTLEIEGEGHSFSKKESEKQWYDALEAFLAKHNPADPIPGPAPVAESESEPALSGGD